MNREINRDGKFDLHWLYIKTDFTDICGMNFSTFRAL